MSNDNPGHVAPGWYPRGDVMQHWDGMDWGDTRPKVADAPVAAAVDDNATPGGAIVPLGYVLAVLFPIGGLVLGIIACTRHTRARKHGPWIIAISVVLIAIYVVVATSGGSGVCTDASGSTYSC